MTDQTQTAPVAAAEEGVAQIWHRSWLVFNELLTHTGVLASLIIFIEALQIIIRLVNHGHDLVFYDKTAFEFQAKWLFDTADAVMIVSILFRGIVSAYIVYRGAKR